MEGIGGFIAFIVGWLIAQFGKFLGGIIKSKGRLDFKEIFEYFVKSGGMPSGHSASFVAVTTYLGFLEGFDSSIFALAVCMTIIIIYDAVNVRRSVGEHGRFLNSEVAIKNGKKPLKVVEGHTVPQVIIGGIIGVLVGSMVYFVLFCMK